MATLQSVLTSLTEEQRKALFIRVPASKTAETSAIKAQEEAFTDAHPIIFLEATQEIWAEGVVYGVNAGADVTGLENDLKGYKESNDEALETLKKYVGAFKKVVGEGDWTTTDKSMATVISEQATTIASASKAITTNAGTITTLADRLSTLEGKSVEVKGTEGETKVTESTVSGKTTYTVGLADNFKTSVLNAASEDAKSKADTAESNAKTEASRNLNSAIEELKEAEISTLTANVATNSSNISALSATVSKITVTKASDEDYLTVAADGQVFTVGTDVTALKGLISTEVTGMNSSLKGALDTIESIKAELEDPDAEAGLTSILDTWKSMMTGFNVDPTSKKATTTIKQYVDENVKNLTTAIGDVDTWKKNFEVKEGTGIKVSGTKGDNSWKVSVDTNNIATIAKVSTIAQGAEENAKGDVTALEEGKVSANAAAIAANKEAIATKASQSDVEALQAQLTWASV